MLKKGEVYELEGMFREKLGAAHGYLWVYEGKADMNRYGLARRRTHEFAFMWLSDLDQRVFARVEHAGLHIKGERKWGYFKSVATGHGMTMPTFAVVVEKESLLRKILRWIKCLNS